MSRDVTDEISSGLLRRSMSREYDISYVILRDEKVKEHESKCFYEMKNSPTIKQSTCISKIYFFPFIYTLY